MQQRELSLCSTSPTSIDASFPTSMVVLKKYNPLGMGLQILLRLIYFGSFIVVAIRRIILAVFIPAASSSTMVIRTLGSPSMTTKLVDC
jgi:hypothetical protein